MTSDSGRPEALAEITIRRLPLSRLIWLGPSASSIKAILDSGTLPEGVSISICPRPSSDRADSGSRTTSANRRPPSMIWVTLSPSTSDCSVESTCEPDKPY